MRYFVICAIPFFLFSSCSSIGEKKETSSVKAIDSFQTHVIDSRGSLIPFTELIKRVEIVRLEETDESLLSNIGFLGQADGMYAITSWSNSDINIFSESGDFIKKINHQGSGPQEYPRIANFWANHEIFGISGGGFIVEYDWEGTFRSKRKNPHRSFHVYPYENGYAMDMSQTKPEGNEHYSIMLVDSGLEVKSMAIPSQFHENGLYGANSFTSYKNSVIYHDPFSDTVFILENSNIRPLFSLDFGDKWFWKDESLRTDREKFAQARKDKDLAWVFTPYVGEEHVLVNCRNSPSYVLIDRKAGTSVNLDMSLPSLDPLNLRPIQWEGDKLAMSIPSAELAPFLSELTTEQKVFNSETTLEEIESSENPVLVWVQFK